MSKQAASLKKEAKKLNAKRLVLPTIKLSEAQYTTISEGEYKAFEKGQKIFDTHL